MIENLENIDPELAAAIVTALIGLIESARRFQATGKIPYTKLPWAAKREIFRWFRRSYFTKDKPDHPSFVVDMTADEVRETLGRQGFVPEWPLSYVYGGEVLNCRTYFYDPRESLPHRQIHVRAFEHPDGLEILAHAEPDPVHHPQAHLESHDMEFTKANDFVKRRLENEVPIGYPGG